LSLGILAIALSGMAFGATDTEVDTGWQLRFHAAAIDFGHGSAGFDRRGALASYDLGAGAGFGINAEYRFTRRLGVDFGVLSGAGVDLEAHTSNTGGGSRATYDTVTFVPVTGGLDIHLTPDNRVDVYVCPLVALIQYGSFNAGTGSGGAFMGIDFDEEFAVGAALGLGVPFGQRRWSFQANLTYLDSGINGTGSNGVRIDSNHDVTMLGVGLGYRF
jgi:hypothetical protein